MNITQIPEELISEILQHLSPFDLEAVATTFHHKLTYVAINKLKPHKSWLRNIRGAMATFPAMYQTPDNDCRALPSFPDRVPAQLGNCGAGRREIKSKHYDKYQLDPSSGPYIASLPPDLCSWMTMDGTFQWLQPPGKRIALEMVPHTGREGDRSVAEDWAIEKLKNEAQGLGLTLPQGFEAFLRSNILHHRIPSFCAWYFQLCKIIKCPSELDGGASGYIVRFHFDQQGCAYAYLYLSTAGWHTILFSMEDLYQSEDDDEFTRDDAEKTIQSKDYEAEDEDEDEEIPEPFDTKNFMIAGLSFEEYIASVYYEELINFGTNTSDGLLEYIRHIYRSPTSVENMRGQSKSVDHFLDAINWENKEKYFESMETMNKSSPESWILTEEEEEEDEQ